MNHLIACLLLNVVCKVNVMLVIHLHILKEGGKREISWKFSKHEQISSTIKGMIFDLFFLLHFIKSINFDVIME